MAAEATERISPRHAPCQDSPSKSQPPSCLESPDRLPALALSMLISADCIPHVFHTLRGAACRRPSRTCSPRNSLGRLGGVGAAPVFAQPSLRPPRNLTRHPNPFRKGTFRLHANRDADSLPRRLRHFQRHGHPGRVFTPGVQRPRWPDREVAVVHACAVQSTRLGGQVTGLSRNRLPCIASGWILS